MWPSEELPSTPGAPLWTRAHGRHRKEGGYVVRAGKSVEKTESGRRDIEETPSEGGAGRPEVIVGPIITVGTVTLRMTQYQGG